MAISRMILIFTLISVLSLGRESLSPTRGDGLLNRLYNAVMLREPQAVAGEFKQLVAQILSESERGEPIEPEEPTARAALLWLEAIWRLSSDSYEEYQVFYPDNLKRLALHHLWDRPSAVASIIVKGGLKMLPADGHTPMKISVNLADHQGFPIEGQDIMVWNPCGFGKIDKERGITDKDGLFTLTYTAPKKPGKDWILVRSGGKSAVLPVYSAGIKLRAVDSYLPGDGKGKTLVQGMIYPDSLTKVKAQDLRPISFDIVQGGGDFQIITDEIDFIRGHYTAPIISQGQSKIATIRAKAANGSQAFTDIFLFSFRLRCPLNGSFSVNPKDPVTREIELILEQVIEGRIRPYPIQGLSFKAHVSGELGLVWGNDNQNMIMGSKQYLGFSEEARFKTDSSGKFKLKYALPPDFLRDLPQDFSGVDTIEIESEEYGLSLKVPIFLDDKVHFAFVENQVEAMAVPEKKEYALMPNNWQDIDFQIPENWIIKKEDNKAIFTTPACQLTVIKRPFVDGDALKTMQEHIDEFIAQGFASGLYSEFKIDSGDEIGIIALSKAGEAGKIAFIPQREKMIIVEFFPSSYLYSPGLTDFESLLKYTRIKGGTKPFIQPVEPERTERITVLEISLCEKLDEFGLPVERTTTISRNIPSIILWYMLDCKENSTIENKWFFDEELFPFYEKTISFPKGETHLSYQMNFTSKNRLKAGKYAIQFLFEGEIFHTFLFQVVWGR